VWRLVFNVFVYAKKTSKLQFLESGKQVDFIVYPCDIDVLYNNLKVDMLPRQSPSKAWQWDRSFAFMQILSETCSPSESLILDLNYYGHMFDVHIPLNNKHVLINVPILIFFSHYYSSFIPFILWFFYSTFLATLELWQHVFDLESDMELCPKCLSILHKSSNPMPMKTHEFSWWGWWQWRSSSSKDSQIPTFINVIVHKWKPIHSMIQCSCICDIFLFFQLYFFWH
jgi:hypothetical protein